MYFGDGMTMEVWETALSHPRRAGGPGPIGGAGPAGRGSLIAGAEGS